MGSVLLYDMEWLSLGPHEGGAVALASHHVSSKIAHAVLRVFRVCCEPSGSQKASDSFGPRLHGVAWQASGQVFVGLGGAELPICTRKNT